MILPLCHLTIGLGNTDKELLGIHNRFKMGSGFPCQATVKGILYLRVFCAGSDVNHIGRNRALEKQQNASGLCLLCDRGTYRKRLDNVSAAVTDIVVVFIHMAKRSRLKLICCFPLTIQPPLNYISPHFITWYFIILLLKS